MYKQIIIARKDLNMSPGKLAAQVSHGSMAFLTRMITDNTKVYCTNQYPVDGYYGGGTPHESDLTRFAEEAREQGKKSFYARRIPGSCDDRFELCDPDYFYRVEFNIDTGIYENWINDIFTKVILEARNKNHLLKAKTMAEELGMMEGQDFFLIQDNCLTELAPEEDGRTLTVIGFKPMLEEKIDQIGKKYQLYR